MKVISKLTVILAASLVLFGLSACANGSKSSDTGTNSGTENEVSNNELAVFFSSDKSQSAVFYKDGTFTFKRKNGSSEFVVGSGIYGGDPSKNASISLTLKKSAGTSGTLEDAPDGNTENIQIINNVFTCEEKQYIRKGCSAASVNESEVWYDTIYKAIYDMSKKVTVKYGDHMLDSGSCENGYRLEEVNGRAYAVPDSFAEPGELDMVLIQGFEDSTKTPFEATFYLVAYQGYYMNDHNEAEVLNHEIDGFSKINLENGYWQWTTYEYSAENMHDTRFMASLRKITAVEGEHILNDKTAEEGYCVYKYTKHYNDRFYAIPEEYFRLEEIGPVLIKEEYKNGKYEATFSIQAHPGYYIDDDHAEKLPEGVEKLLVENKNNGYWQWINESYKN